MYYRCIILYIVDKCAGIRKKFAFRRYTNRMAVCNFLFVGKSNVCPIYHRLWDTLSRNVHDLDLDLSNGPRWNVNTPIERPHATFACVDKCNVSLSVTVCEMITYELRRWTRFDLFTLKTKVKNVDDLNENWQTYSLRQRTCVCKNARFYFQRWHLVTYIHTDGRTYVHTASWLHTVQRRRNGLKTENNSNAWSIRQYDKISMYVCSV